MLLTLLLIPIFNGSSRFFLPLRTSRIVWVTSKGVELALFHKANDVHPVAALCAKEYSSEAALDHYFTTKLLNIMCASELLHRLFLGRVEVRGAVRVAAAHPGLTSIDVTWDSRAHPRPVALTNVRTPAEAAKTVLVPTLYDARKIWGQEGVSSDMQAMPVFENMEVMANYPNLACDMTLREKVYEDTLIPMGLRPGEVNKMFLESKPSLVDREEAPPYYDILHRMHSR
jgi:hypothetical protein